jgi:hypothetical protein
VTSLAVDEEAEGVPGRVEHDPQASRVTINWLMWRLGATAPHDALDRCFEVVDQDNPALHASALTTWSSTSVPSPGLETTVALPPARSSRPSIDSDNPRLSAGTVIGSGTVSNESRAAGSACIAERRVIEIIEHGEPRTEFMRFGDRVEMTARDRQGSAPFGTIGQRVVRAPGFA